MKKRTAKPTGSGWIAVNCKRPPKSGIIIAGSWRKDLGGSLKWTMSSPCDGWGHWFDSDRTHYLRIPKPPKP